MNLDSTQSHYSGYYPAVIRFYKCWNLFLGFIAIILAYWCKYQWHFEPHSSYLMLLLLKNAFSFLLCPRKSADYVTYSGLFFLMSYIFLIAQLDKTTELSRRERCLNSVNHLFKVTYFNWFVVIVLSMKLFCFHIDEWCCLHPFWLLFIFLQ